MLSYWKSGLVKMRITKPGTEFIPLACIALVYLVFGHYFAENPGGHALFLPFNTATWIPVFFLLGFGLWKLGKSKQFCYSELSKFLFIACLLLSIPLIYPDSSFAQSSFRMLGLWAGLLIFVVLQQYDLRGSKLFAVLTIVVIGIWIECLRYWSIMLTDYFAAGQVWSDYKFGMYGIFQQRNVFASFTATGLVISAYLITQYKQQKLGRIFLVIHLLAPIMMYQILVSSASRAGWYGAVLGVVLILPLMYRTAGWKVVVLWAFSWVLGYELSQFLVSAGGFVVPDKDILALEGPRTYLFPQTILMILSKPLLGFGYGTFESSYLHFIADQYAMGKTAMPPLEETFHPHNELLFWGAEGGLVPLAGLLLAAWAVWRTIWKLEFYERLAIIGVFFPLVLHSQVEYPFYASMMHWMTFIILIFYADSLTNVREVQAIGSYKSLQLVGIVMPVFTTWFLVTTIQTGTIYSRFQSRQLPLAAFSEISNAMVWRNHLNWALYSSALMTGRERDQPELIREYINWAPRMISEQPRPQFYEYWILAHLSLEETDEADLLIAEFRHLFPEREFSMIQVN